MRFIIVTDNQGRETWINVEEIAAMAASGYEGYKCQIILKSGNAFRSIATPDEIFEELKGHFDKVVYSRV